MSRVRLTKRAADMSIPYPGNVNQPDRKDPAWDKYHTFEQTVNHELPDMRHDWQNDERDDVGFGVPETWGESPKTPGAAPTVASVRMAANKAVRIAVLLLGEKVEDEVIEEQARDLMSLSASAMDRTLARFADTQKLYAEEKEEEKKAEEKKEEEKKAADEKKEEVKAEDKKEEEKKAADEKKEEVKAEEKKEEEKKAAKKEDEKKAEEKKDEPPAFIKEKMEESKKGSKELAEKKAEEKKEEVKAEDKKEEVKAEDKKEEKKAGSNELDVSFAAAEEEEEEEVDEKTASELASIFEGKESTAAEELDKVEESKKAGIKKLGGQPRVASAEGAGVADISSIWNTAPDVSEIFR